MILFYASSDNQLKDGIHQLMVGHQVHRSVVSFDSLEALEARLRRPHHDIDLIVICVGDAIEMVKLTQMRSLLIDLRIVMVLPHRDADMIAWAHLLGPRFIAYAEDGVRQVGSVLEKMLGKMRPEQKIFDFRNYRQQRL